MQSVRHSSPYHFTERLTATERKIRCCCQFLSINQTKLSIEYLFCSCISSCVCLNHLISLLPVEGEPHDAKENGKIVHIQMFRFISVYFHVREYEGSFQFVLTLAGLENSCAPDTLYFELANTKHEENNNFDLLQLLSSKSWRDEKISVTV